MQANTDPPMTEKPPANVAVGSDETAAAAFAASESPDGKDAPKQISAMQAYVVGSHPNAAQPVGLTLLTTAVSASSPTAPQPCYVFKLSRLSPRADLASPLPWSTSFWATSLHF